MRKIKLTDVIAQLSESVNLDALAPHWDETVNAGSGIPDFLQPDIVRQNRLMTGLPAEAEESLLNAAQRISCHPSLCLLAKHAHRLLFEDANYTQFKLWPSFEPTLGQGGAFWLLIAIDAAPKIDRVCVALGIPETIRAATRNQLDRVEQYRLFHQGSWGFSRRLLPWLRYYLTGKLFRIGRMEYKIEPYNGQVAAWRCRNNGTVIAFVPDGTIVQPNGYIHEQLPDTVDSKGWQATLIVNEQFVEGYPVSPEGCVLSHIIRLDGKEWDPVLQKGDATLDMHIPPGGKMEVAKCGESMRDAFSFFLKYFPKQPCASITCDSWIFNTQLEEILSSDANPVLYQRELYLYPTPSGGKDGFVFIFDKDNIDSATAPRATSLQRAILDFIAAGNRWRKGGMFFLTDDLHCFGQQYYRRHWPPTGLNI
ncbi:MAG: acyltransferase domain-containing protein [Verrucomicrobiota bacterium]